MTNRQVFDVNGRAVTVSLDDPPLRGRRAWSLISARAIDETTMLPPRAPLTIEGDLPRLTPRIGDDGLVGFAGLPEDVFPQLGTAAYTVNMTLRAPRFLRYRRQVNVPAVAGFPANFAPVDLGTIELHREPVSIVGRVVTPTALGSTPIAGATVSITGLWRTPPPASNPPPPAPPNIISIRSGAAYDRAAAGRFVHRLDLNPALGQQATLVDEAAIDSTTIRVANTVAIGATPPPLIAIDLADPELTEYARVVSIDPVGTANEAATVHLDAPFGRIHRRGAIVVPMIDAGIAYANNALDSDVSALDRCLFLGGMTDLAGANFIEITGGPPPAEVHAVQLFDTVADADGFYRLPPLSRVCQVEVTAADGGNVGPPVRFRLDYTREENRLDIAIP